MQFVKNVWLKPLAMYLCPRVVFPSKKWFSQEILLKLVEKQQIFVCLNKPTTINALYNHDLGDHFLCDTNEL
jgi:hypothetical protein